MAVNLRLLYWNPGGILPNLQSLRRLLQEQDIHVVLLGETKLRPTQVLKLPNYFVYRRDEVSASGAPYRGTAVAVRRDVVHEVIPLPSFSHTRSIGVVVSMAGEELRLFAAYRPPYPHYCSQDFVNIFDGGVPTLLVGDLNAKHKAWNSRSINPAGRKLMEDAERQGFVVLGPETPTHVPSDSSHRPDVLDIVLHKDLSCPVHLEVLYDLDTQHLPVLVTLGLGAECVALPRSRRRTDWEGFSASLATYNQGEPLLSPEGVEAAARMFTATVSTALAAATTEVPVEARRDTLPVRLQEALKRKRKLRKLWAETRCPRVKRDLNALTEKLSAELWEHRGATWDARIEQAGDHETSLWQLNRQLTRTKAPTYPLVDADGKRRFKASDRAEILAEYLEEQFSPHIAAPAVSAHHKHVEDRVSEFLSGPTPSLEGLEFISPSETRKVARRLPKRKAPGPDGIPNSALAMLPQRAMVGLTKLYNGILRTGHFPSIWKLGKVIVLPKPGKDPRHPASYRPITLLPTAAKLFERLALKRLRPSLNVRDEQFGFRAGHSTTLQLTRVIHHLSDELNYGRHTVGVFLDIEKAFDRVWHAGLVYKLLASHVPAMLVKLVAEFLDGRQFYVSVENSPSDPRPVSAGVPQGSCLSPALYAVYTNDIPTLEGHLTEGESDVMLALFADDSAFFASSRRAELAAARMQRLLDLLPEWLDKWRMTVNVGKTVATLFSRKRIMPEPLRYRDRVVPWQPTVKYLGCTIDRSLRMVPQADNVVRQARAARAMLRPVLASRLPTRTKVRLYKMYIRSRLTYAAPAWYALVSKSQRKRIQAQQNLSLRTIVGAGRYVRNDVLARDLKVQSVGEFVAQTARRMYDRADNGPHVHLRGLAPLHARPPEGRPLPREIEGVVSSDDQED